MLTKFKKEQGQSIIEVVLALLIIGLMVGALTIATIVSLRNAKFSQNQIQASKYAQDGLEKIRIARDKNSTITSFPPALGSDPTVSSFLTLFQIRLSDYCVGSSGKCNFIIDPATFALTYKATAAGATEVLGTSFSRIIYIEDDSTIPLAQKKITARVTWTDTTGTHESYLQTVLTKQ